MSTGQEKVRRRLPRHERERLILQEATRFFAEEGVEGQTRALAERLGVTQPLLYRYFPDKNALIDRVYHDALLSGWDPEWEELIKDRSRPLAERISEFYHAYSEVHFNFERLRLFMFAGLKEQGIVARHLTQVHENVLLPLCREVRHDLGIDTHSPLSQIEVECISGLHGAIKHMALRQWIYKAHAPEDVGEAIRTVVSSFLMGIAHTFRQYAPQLSS